MTIGPAAIAIPYDTIDVGSANWNASTFTWTCPATGNYLVSFVVSDTGNHLTSSYATITQGSTSRLEYAGGVGTNYIMWTDIVHIVSAATLQFQLSNDNPNTNKNLTAGYNWFAIQQLTAG